jgi:hypothetical protein
VRSEAGAAGLVPAGALAAAAAPPRLPPGVGCERACGQSEFDRFQRSLENEAEAGITPIVTFEKQLLNMIGKLV